MIDFTRQNLESEGLREGSVIHLLTIGWIRMVGHLDDDLNLRAYNEHSDFTWVWKPDLDDANYERLI